MTTLRINIDELQLLCSRYQALEGVLSSFYSLPGISVNRFEEYSIKVRSADLVETHIERGKNQEILDYWYAVDAVGRLLGPLKADSRSAQDQLSDVIYHLQNYLTVIRQNENNSPSATFMALTPSQFDSQFQREFVVGTVTLGKYGTFDIMRQVPGDYAITGTSKSVSFKGDVQIKAGVNAEVSGSYSIVRMASGLDEVIVTTTMSGGVGIEGADGVTVNGSGTITTTYLIEPDQLSNFENALVGSPAAFVPGAYSASIGHGQSINALAIDRSVDVGASANLAVDASVSNPLGTVTGSAEISAGSGATYEATPSGGAVGEYADFHLSAEGSLSLLGGDLADIQGSADVDVRGQVLVGNEGPEFSLSGTFTATGQISLGGHEFVPPHGYNTVTVNVSASVGGDKLPPEILHELTSSDPASQAKGIADALTKGVVVDYNVQYGNTSVSTEGLHAIVANASMTTTREGWVEGEHGEFTL